MIAAGLDRGPAARASRLALVVVLAASLGALGAADAGASKKKRKKGKPSVTRSIGAPFASSSNASLTADCTGKTHATGGGFSVAPNLTPPATGLRTLNVVSHPVGNKGWASGGSAYSAPPASGLFSAFAVCESNKLGKIAIRASSSLTISPAAGQNMAFNCPPGTHVISGGYAGTGLASFATNLNSHRIVVLQNRRTGVRQWTISAFNNPGSPTAATLTGYAVCELDRRKSPVTEASTFVPLADNARTSADATCPGKRHVVSGGFLVSPAIFPGTVPLVGIDENQPVGKKTWHVGLWEYPTALPPGSALQTTAYCKRG